MRVSQLQLIRKSECRVMIQRVLTQDDTPRGENGSPQEWLELLRKDDNEN